MALSNLMSDSYVPIIPHFIRNSLLVNKIIKQNIYHKSFTSWPPFSFTISALLADDGAGWRGGVDRGREGGELVAMQR